MLHQHLYGSPHPKAKPETDAAVEEADIKYCWVCQTNVHTESMHCKYCDKCVSKFDHHCMWLNTCIGSANYKTFFNTVIWTFTFVTLHVGTLIIYLALYFMENKAVRSLAASWCGGANAGLILVGFNIGFLVFTSFCAFMVLQLLVFHMGLRREQITTYQYIIRDSAKKRERMMLSHKVRQRRVQELQNTGNGLEAICLRAGAMRCFETCDPVRRLVLSEVEQSQDENRGNETANRNLNGDSSDSDDGGKGTASKDQGQEKLTAGTPQEESANGNINSSHGADGISKQKNTVIDASKTTDATSNVKGSVCRDGCNNASEASKDPVFIKIDRHATKSESTAPSAEQEGLLTKGSGSGSRTTSPVPADEEPVNITIKALQ